MEIIMKLKEIKNKFKHYFKDEKNNIQGELKEYYGNGQLWFHCYYKNNKKQDEYKVFYSDGQIYIHCYYKDDKLQGEYKEYNPDGSFNTKYYSNGKNVTDMYLKLNIWKSL